jgi:membrane associated rhomboid family serine protease
MVVAMGLSWIFVNLAIGWVGLGGVTAGQPIAWEAHLAGYAAGLVLIGPVAWVMRRI